jgi:hypothetical protein
MMQIQYTNPNGGSVLLGTGTSYGITKHEGLDAPDLDLQTQKAPFQDGDTWIDKRFNPRQVTVTGWILLAQQLAAIDAARASLQAVVNPDLGPGVLTVTNNLGSKILNAIPNPGPKFAWKSGAQPWQAYQLGFTCDDPYYYDLTSATYRFFQVTTLFAMPIGVGWAWPQGTGAAFAGVQGSRSQLLTNVGTAPTPISCVISGPCVIPTVKNTTTGQYITLNLTLNQGDQVAFNTAFGKKTVTLTRFNQAPVNAMGYLVSGSTFFSLPVGSNYIQFSDTSNSTTAQLSLTFSNRYQGI